MQKITVTMDIYTVFRRGVYRHECGGVFATLDEASAAALGHIRNERDDYHEYEVVKFELGVIPPSGEYGPDEPRPVETISRVDPRTEGSCWSTKPPGITVTRFDDQGVEISKTTTITGE